MRITWKLKAAWFQAIFMYICLQISLVVFFFFPSGKGKKKISFVDLLLNILESNFMSTWLIILFSQRLITCWFQVRPWIIDIWRVHNHFDSWIKPFLNGFDAVNKILRVKWMKMGLTYLAKACLWFVCFVFISPPPPPLFCIHMLGA